MKLEKIIRKLRSKKACSGCQEQERQRVREVRCTSETKRMVNKPVAGRRCGRKWFPEHE